jgi:hypothetical protein
LFANLESLGFVTTFSVDKDWALVSVDDATVEKSLLALEGNKSIMCPKQVSKCYRAAQVGSYTRSSGYIIGKISESPLFTRLPNSVSFQEVYKVELAGGLATGDSGSAVFDIETGDYFGHIVAGCETSGIAYVMAAHHVFEDMEKHLGASLLLYSQSQDPLSVSPEKTGRASISSTSNNNESISHQKTHGVKNAVNDLSTVEELAERPKRISEDPLKAESISHAESLLGKAPAALPGPVVNSTTILQMVAWGTRLSFGLYDFSANVPPASGDIDSLAKEVNLLSLVLRQIGSNLKEEGGMTSERAFNTVIACLEQCRVVFVQIEQLVPVRALQDAPGNDPLLTKRLRTELNWTPLCQSQSQYLLAYSESLKMTLSVMLQTLYTAKITLWSRSVMTRPPIKASKTNHVHRTQVSQLAADAVVTERLQMETLVIEQQLSILRTNRRYRQLNEQLQSTRTFAPEFSPHPRGLNSYQDPSLTHNFPSSVEGGDLTMVRRISAPLIDTLLFRWTKLFTMESRMREQPPFRSTGSTSKLPHGSFRIQTRLNKQPSIPGSSVSSEDEAEIGMGPKLNLSTHTTSGIYPIPTRPSFRGISRASQLLAQESSSLHALTTVEEGSGELHPSTTASALPKIIPPQHWRQDILRSRARSIKDYSDNVDEGFVGSNSSTLGSDASPKNNYIPQQQQQQPQSISLRRAIPWRLRLRQNYWDFLDNNLTSSNTPNTPQSAHYDRNTITEIMSEFVSRDALREGHYYYTRVKKETGDGSRVRLESCYCIEGALSFNEIVRLVDLTTTIRFPPPPRPM